MSRAEQFRPTGRSTMARFATIAIVLAVCSVPRSSGIDLRRRSIEGKPAVADTLDEDIREIFRLVSTGTSSKNDDEQLVKLVKEEIVRTAQSIETPSGSIEAAAKKAQRLVTELTTAYTTAIYKSKSTKDAGINFVRFQGTVQRIVDFIKTGQFVV